MDIYPLADGIDANVSGNVECVSVMTKKQINPDLWEMKLYGTADHSAERPFKQREIPCRSEVFGAFLSKNGIDFPSVI